MTPLTPAKLRVALEASSLSPALVAEVMATVQQLRKELEAERSAHLETRRELSMALADTAPDSINATPTVDAIAKAVAAERERSKQWAEAVVRVSNDANTQRAKVAMERAKVARLRSVLTSVRDAMAASGQGPDCEPDQYDPRRPLASEVWRALADTAPDSTNTPDSLKPQPPPTRAPNSVEVWPSLIAKYGDRMSDELRALCEARHRQGVAKYGVALTIHNGRDAKTDELQEALDGMAYGHQDELESAGADVVRAQCRTFRNIEAAEDVLRAQRISARGDVLAKPKGGA